MTSARPLPRAFENEAKVFAATHKVPFWKVLASVLVQEDPEEAEGGGMTTARYGSDVVISPALYRRGYPVVDYKALLPGERHEDASGGFRVDLTGQGRLAGAYRGPLFRTVAAILVRELIGVHDGIDLARKAKAHPYLNGFCERLRKHRNLPIVFLCGYATALAGILHHPGQRCAHFLKDSERLREAGERISRRGSRIVAVEGALAGAKGSHVDWAASLLRPLIEKFQCVFEARDFLNYARSLLYEYGAVEHPIVHQILQVERILAFRVRRGPARSNARNRYVFGAFCRQEPTGRNALDQRTQR